MLTIEPPYYQVRGIVLFRDHADPDQFYYLPPPPRLARSGARPLFTLLKYRRDLTDNPALDPTRARGAGLAFFEVEAALDPGQVAALTSEVASQAGRPDARLVPVLFRSGEVRALIAHAEGDRFIQDLSEVHAAPIAAPHHAAFALALSAEGATLMQRAAAGGPLPVGVAYELRFLALTPALHARVHMDYSRVYDRFAASIGFQYKNYVRAELDAELQWLVEHDIVKIEITAFTDTEDQKRQQQLVHDLIVARLQQDFFQPNLPPDPTSQGNPMLSQLLGAISGGGGGKEPSSSSALFVLKAKYQMEKVLKTFDLVFDSRTAIELTHVITGFLSALLQGGEPPDIREIDLDDPFFSSLEVSISSTADFGEMADLRELNVHLSFADYRKSYTFSRKDAGPFTFQAPLTRPAEDEYGYEVEYLFDPDGGQGPARIAAGPFRSRHRALAVNPAEHLTYRRARFLLGPVDATRVPRIHVRVRAPGPEGQDDLAREEFVLDAADREHVFRQRLLPTATELAPLRVRTEWEDASGARHAGDEEDVGGDSYVVLGPFRDVLEVLVQPAVDWQKVSGVRVELRYEDGDYVVDRVLEFTAPAAQRVEVPILDARRRQYRWSGVLVHKDGPPQELTWQAADRQLLVVGPEKRAEREVRMVLVGTGAEVLGVRVDLWAVGAGGDEQQFSVFLRPGQETEKGVALPLDRDGQLAYRYEVRRYTAAGEELLRSGQGNSPMLVVQASK